MPSLLRTLCREAVHFATRGAPRVLPAGRFVPRAGRIGASLALLLASGRCPVELHAQESSAPFSIEVVDAENGWPVPLVEFRTTHELSFVTDNAGRVAIDAPELLDREVWFHVRSDGYELDRDGFGYRGRRFALKAGGEARVKIRRTAIAKRIGRLTGSGLFAESRKLGLARDWRDGPTHGCDSVQMATLGDRRLWLWGDTNIARYPLGIFHTSAAFSPSGPLDSFEPPLRPPYEPILDEHGAAAAVAKLPGSGPTWLSAAITLPDREGQERVGASYVKISPPLEAYEQGLCVFDPDTRRFTRHRLLWEKSSGLPRPPAPDGHASFHVDTDGTRWALFGNPLPRLRCRARFEDWENPEAWETIAAPATLDVSSAGDAEPASQVRPHSGSIAWSEHRRRWVTVFLETFGKPSAFGEIWYAEARSPLGPWGRAVKVLSHANYTFYNPRIDSELAPPDAPFLLFEGTYTVLFADRPAPTPRYEYNQLLYRLDLDDPRLAPARSRDVER